jgi:recombination protein RecR
MAYHLLLGKRQKGLHLADSLTQAMQQVKHCKACNTFSSEVLCRLCSSKSRDNSQLCIVEMPLDQLAIEKTGTYTGQYFVLMGHLSPIDGIGPEQLGIDKLVEQCRRCKFEEVIFALNPSMEGEATIYYLKNVLKPLNVRFSQLARGVPMGGELEYLDLSTIGRALSKRSLMLDDEENSLV